MTRLEALAFNALTGVLSDLKRFVPLTGRRKAANAVLDAVLPEYERLVREHVLPDGYIAVPRSAVKALVGPATIQEQGRARDELKAALARGESS